jgi:glycosyltransferase involved in cell wall biosynthesis
MQRLLVSVITPAFNAEETLPYSIESVLNQTLASFEMIVIDDASTDYTRSIAEYYAGLDSRITIVHNQRNSRMGPIQWEPRNDGLRIATGNLIAYLDADNTWRPEFLERLASILSSDASIQLVHCDSCNHYSAKEKKLVVRRDARKLVSEGETWTVFSHDDLDVNTLGSEQYVDTNEIVHRASVFEALGSLWHTYHPHRAEINRQQGGLRPFRRHNDLELFERIVAEFGAKSVFHLKEVHVDFFYPSCARPRHPISKLMIWKCSHRNVSLGSEQ